MFHSLCDDSIPSLAPSLSSIYILSVSLPSSLVQESTESPIDSIVKDYLALRWKSRGADEEQTGKNIKDVDALLSRVTSEGLLIIPPPSSDSSWSCS